MICPLPFIKMIAACTLHARCWSLLGILCPTKHTKFETSPNSAPVCHLLHILSGLKPPNSFGGFS